MHKKMLLLKMIAANVFDDIDQKLLCEIIPELHDLKEEQYLYTIQLVKKVPNILQVKLAALLHTLEKTNTSNYAKVSADLAYDILIRLEFDYAFARSVHTMILLHPRFLSYNIYWGPKAIRNLSSDAGHLFDWNIELALADCSLGEKEIKVQAEERIRLLQTKAHALANKK